jgi:hypothetical protein
MWVAEAYLPAQHLIGPALLPVYRTVRKVMVAAMAAIFAGLYVLFAFVLPVPPKPELASLEFWVWHLVVYAFAGVGFQTVLFAWLERSSARARAADAWDPRHPDSPPVVPGRLEVSEAVRLRVVSLGHLVGAVAFTLWWLGVLRLGPPPPLDVRLTPIEPALHWAIFFVGLSGALLAAALVVRPRRERAHAVLGLGRELVAFVCITALLGGARVVEVAIPGAPSEGVALVGYWLNVSAVVTLAVFAVLYAAEAVRDARMLLRRPPIRHGAFRVLAGD